MKACYIAIFTWDNLGGEKYVELNKYDLERYIESGCSFSLILWAETTSPK